MTRPTPDLQGFAEAQENLRTHFGEQVRFYGPASIIYDPALTPYEFDNEGIPLDPLAGASAVNADTSVPLADLTLLGSAVALTVFSALSTSVMRRDQTIETQLAIRSALNQDLIMSMADMPLASGATHYQVGETLADGTWVPSGEMWKIVNGKIDSFGTVERYIIYGEGTL